MTSLFTDDAKFTSDMVTYLLAIPGNNSCNDKVALLSLDVHISRSVKACQK